MTLNTGTLPLPEKSGAQRPLTIDMHCHILTPEVERMVADYPQKIGELELALKFMGAASVEENLRQLKEVSPKLTDLSARLDLMDNMGVDIQIISPIPSQYYYWADPDLAERLVRVQNEDIAAQCAQQRDRLAGLGNIALQHPDLAIEQLRFAVKELGLMGVEISSAVNGHELDEPMFHRFWAAAEDLECLVFLHPWGTSLGERANRYYLANIIGQPIETTIALSRLIFGGVLDRCPNLKILAAHGGGYLPSCIGRSDHAHRVRPESKSMRRMPSEYLKRIFFDTLLYSPEGLRHLVEEVGLSQVMVGTDYPFDMGHYDAHALIAGVAGLSEEDQKAILGGNAARLLQSCGAASLFSDRFSGPVR
jgi:aminocarboxymuconate-semialdehyde decarboxylase